MAKKAKLKYRLDSTTVSLVTRLARDHIRPLVPRLIFSLVCMAIAAAMTGAMAKLMEPILDEVFKSANVVRLNQIAVLILVVFAVKGLATYGQGVTMNYVGMRIIADVQRKMFEHVIGADLAFFHSNSTGTLISRFTNDANMLRGAVSNALTGIGKDTLTLVSLIGVMFYQDWVLALVSFFAFPTAIWPIVRLGRRMRKVSANTQAEYGQFTTILEESFQGARHVKAYGMEHYEASRANALVERLFQLAQKAARTRNASSPIMEMLGGFAIVAVIFYGGYQVIHSVRTPGAFFSFVTALLLAYEPLKRLANLNASLQEGLASAQRIFTLLDEKATIVDRPGAGTLKVERGVIQFERVRFGYGQGHTALHDLTLEVPAGKTVALVGPSGAGKSTILNLIPRFYDVGAGRVTIDGADVRDVTLTSLRANIGLVSQEISLFDDTVVANIAYGKPDSGQAEIERAARMAGAHDFIVQLPKGYETQVGGHGARLSGGQRQRIAIARAMLKGAPILLLDEATSALDTETERAVQAALAELMRGRTTLVVAHRLSTVVDADLIYVIDDGRVMEAGNHAELLARKGIYARLYALQMAEEGTVSEVPAPDMRGARARA
ncbi:MAG TPA: ABC transporter ATP-binding protein [Alphaproteobacteria bacterium]|nr:ABC transporter ATP-binding protein [Alphaproteobacteria bacterium]